ncbi:MAG: CBS domain-containing protein [Planctomycetota bacterium]|nr:MAG: CBS domain-containing protein [Planctomycetota bacterium]
MPKRGSASSQPETAPGTALAAPERVERLMTPLVQTCRPGDSMNNAARIMWEHDVGCVPVVAEDGILVGVVTDRDLCMAAYTQGANLHQLTVSAAMSGDVVTCTPGVDPASALLLMQARQVRRLPVVDEDGRLVGILSLADLARAGQPGASELAQALSWICRPRAEEAAAPAPARRPAR